MLQSFGRIAIIPALVASLFLSACGGGGGSDSSSSGSTVTLSTLEPNSPQMTGDTVTDGMNWFNFRRHQLGLSTLLRSTKLDTAAQGHSNYQKLNNAITHVQTVGKPGFTGINLIDRLTGATYTFSQPTYAYGEVISSSTDPSGVNAAEGLITAIYHRFVVFEPMFKELGVGVATVNRGNTYFTTDFAADGLNAGLGVGRFITYPFDGQQRVPLNFFSDSELPDPVPGRNEVGYPISIHADITAAVTVQSFTIQPHGGVPLVTQLMTHALDSKTSNSVAAIIPLEVLASKTTYDVSFSGTVDGQNVSRSWSFTTQ